MESRSKAGTMEGPQCSRDHTGGAGGLGFLIRNCWECCSGATRKRGVCSPWFSQTSPEFQWFSHAGPDKPAVELSQWEDKCPQGTAHCSSSLRTGTGSALPGKLMELPQTQLPLQGFQGSPSVPLHWDAISQQGTAQLLGNGIFWPRAGQGPC